MLPQERFLANKFTPFDNRPVTLDEVTSTSDVCFERARQGDGSGLWVLADRQTGGRGRRGRKWVSEKGNFYGSLLLVDDGSTDVSTLPLTVAVAVARAIDLTLPDFAPRAQVKWPNDVLINGKKVCGILLEVEHLDHNRRAIVIGCGVNIRHHPNQTLYPTTSLSDQGAQLHPRQFYQFLEIEMADILALWDGGQNLSQVRQQWIDRASGVGDEIEVRLPNHTYRGRFMGIGETGNLLLKTDDGSEIQIAAGDVFLGRALTP